MGLYVVRVSMSLGLTSFLYGSLCCPSFHVTWSHFRSAWVSMLSECICHLVTLPLGMAIDVVRFSMYLVSLPFCMGICIFRVSMALGLTFVMYGSVCCPIVYVT